MSCMASIRFIVIVLFLIMNITAMSQETLRPIQNGKVPQDFEELWAGYNPRQEPLDVEILKEWEEDL